MAMTNEELQTKLTEAEGTIRSLRQENENFVRLIKEKDATIASLKDDNYRLFRNAVVTRTDQTPPVKPKEDKISVDDATKLVKKGK